MNLKFLFFAFMNLSLIAMNQKVDVKLQQLTIPEKPSIVKIPFCDCFLMNPSFDCDMMQICNKPQEHAAYQDYKKAVKLYDQDVAILMYSIARHCALKKMFDKIL